jgi:hypothetical protein
MINRLNNQPTEVQRMKTENWFQELQNLKMRPGQIDCMIDLYNDVQTESVKEKILKDIKVEILNSVVTYRAMFIKFKNDPIAKPTKAEIAYLAWAEKQNFGD